MSLLDDVSIVVTPNGYKAGTLYGVLPVPTYGSEEVTYPNFTNSDISQWKIASSRATPSWDASEFMRLTYDLASGSALYATFGLTLNVVYKVTMRVRGTKADGTTAQGSAFSSIGNNNELGRAISNPTLTADWQDYEFYTVPTGSTFRFYLSSATIGDLVDFDSISVKEYTSADMDVTRETAATRVDEDGLVNYAEVLGSELVDCSSFDCANPDGVWSTVNSTISSGKATVTVVGGASSYITQTLSYISGQKYKLTATINGTSGKEIKLQDRGNNSGGLTTTNGTVTLDGSDQNIEIYWIANSNSDGIVIARSTTSGDYSFTIDNVSVKKVDLDNVPRIDYTGGGCPHILAEPQRTNLLTYSEDFSQTDWQKIKSSVTSGFSSPDGGNNAYRWQEDTNSGVHSLKEPYSFTSVDYSQSIFIKPNGRSNVLLWVDGASKGTRFDLSSGTIYSETSSVGKITAMNDGWFKISTTVLGTSGTAFNLYSLDNSGNISYTGDGTSGFYVYGAQLEESYATSYIPTSGSTVTRNQDIFTRDGIGSLINDSEGVLFVEMAALADDLTFRSISLNDGTNTNSVGIRYRTTSNRINAIIKDGNGVTFQMNFDVSDITEFNKIALKYKSGDNSLYINGTEVLTNSSTFSFTSALNDASFNRGDGNDDFYGKVKQLQVYNTALTDEQLLQLTGESGTDFYESYAEMATALTYTIQ